MRWIICYTFFTAVEDTQFNKKMKKCLCLENKAYKMGIKKMLNYCNLYQKGLSL